MTATSLETVKLEWDGDSLIPDVQKTQYADGGYDTANCQKCGKSFELDELKPDEE